MSKNIFPVFLFFFSVAVFFGEPLLIKFNFENEIVVTEEQEKERNKSEKFMVTAYYAPLPNQENYVTGSYISDKILNGWGVTYSGKKPDIGHVAADLDVFCLGTRLYVPGYGLGVVEDTGGRIKGKRLDVFMGYGDEGMKKALEWGVKLIKIEVAKVN